MEMMNRGKKSFKMILIENEEEECERHPKEGRNNLSK